LNPAFILPLLSPAALAQDAEVQPVLARLRDWIGGPEALAAAGGVEVAGVLVEGGAPRSFLNFVFRLRPFGFREAWTLPVSPQPARLMATDGEKGWSIGQDGRGERLPREAEADLLDRAFLESMRYLDLEAVKWRIVGEENGPPPRRGVPQGEGFEEPARVAALAFTVPSGREWHLLVDPETGALHERHVHEGGDIHWVRLGRWERRGPLRLPTRGFDGSTKIAGNALFQADEVRTGIALADDLFRPPEAPPKRPLSAASPMPRAAASLPGSFYLVLPYLWIGGHGPFPGLLDTGASRTAVAPDVAAGLGLPLLQVGKAGTVFGPAGSNDHWAGEIRVGAEKFPNLTVMSISVVGLPEVPPSLQPRVVIGMDAILMTSAVLDLAGERLYFRGPPVRALADLLREGAFDWAEPGSAETRPREPRVVEVPLRFEGEGKASATVDVRVGKGKEAVAALLDTGFPAHLRLTKKALVALGLPTDPAEWKRRGAFPRRMHGAGGVSGVDLVAQLESISFGPVTIPGPFVYLAGLEGGEQELDFVALLGSASLFAFPKVGVDAGRKVLELELPPGSRQAADGSVEVPSPGEFLGLSLGAPALPFGPEPETLPRVVEVFPGSAAERAGVAAGDFLLEVDGAPVRGIAPAALHPRLWAREGRKVELRLRRAEGGAEYALALP
jgi:predicted aspartyl protease